MLVVLGGTGLPQKLSTSLFMPHKSVERKVSGGRVIGHSQDFRKGHTECHFFHGTL